MRVTEQIDALEIMGINSANHLILPKIAAGILIIPFLVVMSMVLGIASGTVVALATGVSSMADFEYGMRIDFKAFDVVYALSKTTVFAFILTSVPGYHGYYAQGGALEVGAAATRGVVWSVVVVMVANLVLTQLLLS
jgi:phospholipid/cholesterol/gamma-HCH transport system permease protein